MRILFFMLALTLAHPAAARDMPDAARMKADVERLVSFGTRHTLSSPDNPARGIGAARRWVGAELTRIGDGCGGCITVANVARGFSGPRAPEGVKVVNVLGFQAGTEAKRVVIVMGHIDSRVADVMDAGSDAPGANDNVLIWMALRRLDAGSDAPGANDNASGVALVIEAARILSKRKFAATIVYAVLSGEEQGLWGGQLLAETAKEKGWNVVAVLNNDIVGGTIGQNGQTVADRVRVFSEGIRMSETLEQQMARRASGGEDDGPSRALAKAVRGIAATLPGGLDVFVVRRAARFGRGGDHEAFLKLGFPAIRFSVGIENDDWQHQDLRSAGGVRYGDTVDRMDFGYLAKVTAINVATIARLASAPPAPVAVRIDGALAMDTRVTWDAAPGATGYRIHWRRSDRQDWTDHRDVAADTTRTVLTDVVVVDHFVGVSALAADGSESIVTFAVRGR